MTECRKYEALIEKYLDGELADTGLAELRAHVEQCEGCREQYERMRETSRMVKAALSSPNTAGEASKAVLSRIGVARFVPAGRPVFGKYSPIAAGVLLAMGLVLGFNWGRRTATEQPKVVGAAKVPIRVAGLEGTVIVRHQGSDVWQEVAPESDVYLGDTFHCAAKSGCVLELQDKSTLELNQNSMLVLELCNGGTELVLEHGQLAADLQSAHGPFFISTPHGRVEALGTEFTVTVE